MVIFYLSDLNPRGEDLQIGVVNPTVIEDLYKRLNDDLIKHPGKQPQFDPELNVGDKVLYNYNKEHSYHRYGMRVRVDYQLFESLCGCVFTTTISSRPCAELAITISDAIKYGMVRITKNPDLFEIPNNYVMDRDYYYTDAYNTEMLTHAYDGYDLKDEMNCSQPYFGVWVEIIPDPVMTKNATKV